MPDVTLQRNTPRLYLRPVLIIAVGLLALLLRLVFIFGVSQIEVIGDATTYWLDIQSVRSLTCSNLHYCSPGPIAAAAGDTFPAVLSRALIERNGIMPVIVGLMLTILPESPYSIYALFAVLGSLTCMMVVAVLLRLEMPLWASLLAGILQAVYIPAITGDGAILQQPLIRFFLVVTIWTYTMAITGRKRSPIQWWVITATIAVGMVAYTSVTTRPLLWLIPLVVLLLARGESRLRELFRIQSRVFGILVVALLIVPAASVFMGMQTTSTIMRLTMGLSGQADAAGSSTVASFPHFWPPTEWWSYTLAHSLVTDFTQAPGSFIYWLLFSVTGNWRYPDYLYLQEYILSLDAQKVQHVVFTVTGLLGLAWMLGQRGPRRQLALLMVIIGLYVTLSSSAISVEPRRISPLSPFIAVGAAVFVTSLVANVRLERQHLVNGLILTLCIGAWWLPLTVLREFLPIDSFLAYTLLVGIRGILAAFVVLQVVRAWQRNTPSFSNRWAAIPLLAVVALLSLAQFQDSEWRSWQISSGYRVRQEIQSLQRPEHLFPWLLIDIADENQAQDVAIYVNDQIVKPPGEPMFTWEAGIPPTWPTYETLTTISNTNPTRRLWFAYPIPPSLLADDTNIELRAGEETLTLTGDYVDADGSSYVGPLFDPWHTGHSFWRWQWNANDPRIPWEQSLDGQQYRSAYFDGVDWVADDLSPEFGRAAGLYRIFITWAAFGENTNAVALPSAEEVRLSTPTCSQGELLAAAPTGLNYAYLNAADGVSYFIGDISLGTSPLEVFQSTSEPNQVIDIRRAPQGRIELIQVLRTVFVANFYDHDGEALYSLAFTFDV